MNENNIVTKNAEEGVVLELTKENFAEIILNFLGHKQKLQYNINNINFLLNKENLAQFDYLLSAKIEKEQYTHLNSFIVKLEYSDRTKRIIHGVNALETFLETRSIAPETITLEWKVILQYPNAVTMESQDIQLTFNISSKDNVDSLLLNVEHTNQSWGVEVLNLFKDHIDTIIQKKPIQVKIAEAIKSFIVPESLHGLVSFLAMFLLPMIIFSGILRHNDDYNIDTIASLIQVEKPSADPREFDLSLYLMEKNLDSDTNLSFIKSTEYKEILEQQILNNEENISLSIRRIVSAFGLIFTIIIISYLYVKQNHKYYGRKSFILLTNKAEQQYRDFIESKSKLEYFSLSALFFAITVGVIGNFIYQWIIQ